MIFHEMKRLPHKNAAFPIMPLKCNAPQATETNCAAIFRKFFGLGKSPRNSLALCPIPKKRNNNNNNVGPNSSSVQVKHHG